MTASYGTNGRIRRNVPIHRPQRRRSEVFSVAIESTYCTRRYGRPIIASVRN
jgi:hypothetical protein